MHRHELTDEQARAHLAGQIRNYCTAPGVTFHPWTGLDLSFWDGTLYRVQNRQRTTPLLSVNDVVDGMSDEAIERAVLQGRTEP